MENGDLKLAAEFMCWVQVIDLTKDYNSTLKEAFSFDTIKRFWTFYQHMHRPPKLTTKDNIYIFKKGIFPTWQSQQNKNGGCFRIKLKKAKSSRNWQDFILLLISPNNKYINDINGIRLKIKQKFDEVQVWIVNLEQQRIQSLKDHIRKVILNDEENSIEHKKWTKDP